mmetsp:Transcript_30285/g.66612  ORF Transcript_30285/g.66612 Transcript_30285/m.66612 type:complete len:364 (+) Transcript_30285:200-1291(+)
MRPAILISCLGTIGISLTTRASASAGAAFAPPSSYTLSVRRNGMLSIRQSAAGNNENQDAVPEPAPTSSSPPPPKPQQPSSDDLMKAMGTNPRRIFLSLTTSTGIALAANFLGITSTLLASVPPDVLESTSLDTYYPVNDFKRYNGGGYTLTIPKEWVADTAVELAKATRRAGTLDYGMKRPGSGAPGAGVLPDAAFGPPGKKDARGLTPQGADTNVSVVSSRLRPGFSLRGSLGPPKDAAETLLRVSLAPEGSGRVGTLLTASEEHRGRSSVYQFEYDIDRGERGVERLNITTTNATTRQKAARRRQANATSRRLSLPGRGATVLYHGQQHSTPTAAPPVSMYYRSRAAANATIPVESRTRR